MRTIPPYGKADLIGERRGTNKHGLFRAGNTDPSGYALPYARGYRGRRRIDVSQRFVSVLIGTLTTVIILGLCVAAAAQNGQPAHQQLIFEGDTALWTMAI
jgi:hypothetical protein